MVYESITGDITGASLGLMFMYFAMAIVIVYVVMKTLSTRRTQDYRKELTDMYVAGRIRQLAEQNKVDLDIEYEAFKKWRKLRRRERQDIDEAIESELKEKLEEKLEEKKIKEKA